jgi:hypothetical protein
MNAEQEMIGERAELLARVALTRRMNVTVHPFDEGGAAALDLICTIRDDDLKGFLPFGVMVWGTAKVLAHGGDVSPIAQQKLKHRDTRYFFPVIILVFSMHNDAAFFSWLVQPDPSTDGKLRHFTNPVFRSFTTKQLDMIVKSVVNWYANRTEDIEHVEMESNQ